MRIIHTFVTNFLSLLIIKLYKVILYLYYTHTFTQIIIIIIITTTTHTISISYTFTHILYKYLIKRNTYKHSLFTLSLHLNTNENYFTIQLISATIHEPHCTFWYYS